MNILKEIILLSAFILLFVSCGDIVDSDENILITELKYKSIKEDQESSVLMPLKSGNEWYYDITEYYTDGTIRAKYVDSAEVIRETVIDNERWFEVRCPVLSDENLFLSNTDVGLWCRCGGCENESFLLARYPVVEGAFASGYPDIDQLLIENNEYPESLKKLTVSKTIVKENISVPLGDFECFRFTGRFESDSELIKQYPIMDEYYSVDVGLVKVIQYGLLSGEIVKVYELRKEPDHATGNDCLESLHKDIDDIANNTVHTEPVDIENTTPNRVNIEEIIIDYENSAGLIEISIKSMPFTLVMGESETMDIKVSPKQTGQFDAVIKVMSNIGCLYEITVTGKSI